MPVVKETILAPELEGGEWVQGGPLKLTELRDSHVVLIDFWDYTCVNCLRTLPYVAEWHRRYAAQGLAIIGVHAPEFSFARNLGNVAAAIRQFNIEYPVVLDNGYAIWRAYSNRVWPAKYLIDREGRLRYYHFGEGNYGDTELAIQRLLHEGDASLKFPAPLEPLRRDDRPGAVCYRVTPELYLGYARGQFGNPAGVVHEQAHRYRDPGRHMEGLAYLEGEWTVGGESARAESPGASLAVRYTAMEVNLVMAPAAAGPVQIDLELNGQTPGEDVRSENGRTFISIERPRMYCLARNASVEAEELKLTCREPGVSFFAFTFISCPVEAPD